MVRWEAIIGALKLLNFPSKLIDWIFTCLRTTKYSNSVNGALEGYFDGHRGGDPMSPYLFVLVMEVLGSLLRSQVQEGLFALHPRCISPQVTHLAFADDLLVFFGGDIVSASSLGDCLNPFYEITGLEANLGESKVFFAGVEDTDKES
jgi:hypothetical protein